MSEPFFSMMAEEDLPRTIRREREARERQARERQAHALMPLAERDGPGATVTGIDVPFPKLVMFSIKAVFAAIPALLALTAVLWLLGQGLQSFFPQLLKLKIDIQIYSPQAAAEYRIPQRPPR
jgi:hypothetical protein